MDNQHGHAWGRGDTWGAYTIHRRDTLVTYLNLGNCVIYAQWCCNPSCNAPCRLCVIFEDRVIVNFPCTVLYEHIVEHPHYNHTPTLCKDLLKLIIFKYVNKGDCFKQIWYMYIITFYSICALAWVLKCLKLNYSTRFSGRRTRFSHMTSKPGSKKIHAFSWGNHTDKSTILGLKVILVPNQNLFLIYFHLHA